MSLPTGAAAAAGARGVSAAGGGAGAVVGVGAAATLASEAPPAGVASPPAAVLPNTVSQSACARARPVRFALSATALLLVPVLCVSLGKFAVVGLLSVCHQQYATRLDQ